MTTTKTNQTTKTLTAAQKRELAQFEMHGKLFAPYSEGAIVRTWKALEAKGLVEQTDADSYGVQYRIK